jgi:hypothetical protein
MVTAGHSHRELGSTAAGEPMGSRKQPRKLQEQMEKVVLEGNNARAALHKVHNRMHKDIL